MRADPDLNQLEYIDFEIEIGPGQGREYPVSVVRSPAGEAEDVLRFPYDSLALDNRLQALEIALLRSGGQRRRLLSPEEQTVQEFGRALFDALMAGDVRSRYDISRREAATRGKGLRLKLRVQPPELAALPWEFLYDSRLGEYVSLSLNTPVVRYPAVPHPIQPLQITPPLRVLVMIANPRDLQPLDVQRERQRIEVAVGSLHERHAVRVTVLEGQTWRELQRAMRAGPWHIFHFVGHGGFDQNTEEGLVAFADESGKAHYLTATLLGRLLADHYPLRLVLLNSCEGARGSDRDIFSSTAATLVQRGIPAVVAMQYEISDDAAIEFARTFYESIADGLPVDAAVAEARKAISLAVSNTLEWGTPVLFMRAPDGRVFDVDRAAPPQTAESQQPATRNRQAATAASTDTQRRQRLDAAYTQALSAFYTRDWEQARALFEAIVAEQPNYEDAAEKLKETQRQQQLADRYAAGVRAYESQAWAEATAHLRAVIDLDSGYRDAPALLKDVQHRAMLAELYAEARRLHAAQAWPAVISVFERIHAADPDFPDPENLLESAREALAAQEREQQLAARYREGLGLLGLGEWASAASLFESIEAQQPGYRESAQLLARARHEVTAQEEQERRRTAEQDLISRYDAAQRAIDNGEWSSARQLLESLERSQPGYRDVDALLDHVKRHITPAVEEARAAQVFQATAAQPTPRLAQPDATVSTAGVASAAEEGAPGIAVALATLGWMLAWALIIVLYIQSGQNPSTLVLTGPLCYAVGGWFTGLAINIARADSSRQLRFSIAAAWALAWAIGYPLVLLAEQGLEGPMWIVAIFVAAGTALALWQIQPPLQWWRIGAFCAGLLIAQLIGDWIGAYFITRWIDNIMGWILALMLALLIAGGVNGLFNGLLIVALLRRQQPTTTQRPQPALEQREVVPSIAAGGFALAGYIGLTIAILFWDPWGGIASGWWYIGWALGGLVTGLVLQRITMLQRWQIIGLITVGWAAALVLMSNLWPWIASYKDSPSWVSGWLAGMAVAGAIGGALAGLGVARSDGRAQHIGLSAAAWAPAFAVGGLVVSLYAPWSYDWWIADYPLWRSGWLIAGAIVGAIGGAINLRSLQPARSDSPAESTQ